MEHGGDALGEAEFKGLFTEHSAWMLVLARRYSAGPVEAADIVQQVWARVVEESESLPAPERRRAWLHRLVRQLGRTVRRRRSRRRQLLARFALTQERNAGSLMRLGAPRARAELDGAVAQLPRLQREVVMLHVVSGLTLKETAARLGKAEGTVKSSLHRALRRLREILPPERLSLIAELLEPEEG